jgi:DNA repair exonuclease SbcCD nuclease subunit
MHNILLYSDLHISQSSLKECTIILEEISMLANKYKIDTLINLGDTFDNLKPSSSELDVLAKFIKNNNDKKHIIIAANSHESETEEISILNHYGILSDNVIIVKEYKDQDHLLCIHDSIKESPNNYGAKYSVKDFNKFLYVFAGHIHSYYLVKPNFCGLGSCRWVNFDESKDKQKIIAIISDYNIDKEQVHFLKLKTPTPMIEIILKNEN